MSETQPIRAAAIANGIVVNVEMIEPGFERDGVAYVPSETAGIGDRYEGGEFVRPEIEPQPDPVPEEVGMAQARAALIVNGLFAKAEAALAAMEGVEGELARNDWEYRASIRRDHPLIVALGRTLDLDEETIDDLFRQAATL